jgi:hypothetical protein
VNQETFVNHRGFLWFWVILSAVIALSLWYYLDQPLGGRSGSSLFGYTSGVLSAAAILLLTWFGIRKRSYSAHLISLKGWLAFHIWLGLALIIVVPLHAAFEFDFNVHTYAYVALCIVVLSGMVGVYFYRALPLETISNRGGGALKKRFKEIEICDKQINDCLSANQNADALKALKANFNIEINKSLLSYVFSQKVTDIDPKVASGYLSNLKDQTRAAAISLLSILANKRKLVQSIAREKTVLFKLRLWLFFHIPFTCLLLVLLAVHIFSIFSFGRV